MGNQHCKRTHCVAKQSCFKIYVLCSAVCVTHVIPNHDTAAKMDVDKNFFHGFLLVPPMHTPQKCAQQRIQALTTWRSLGRPQGVCQHARRPLERKDVREAPRCLANLRCRATDSRQSLAPPFGSATRCKPTGGFRFREPEGPAPKMSFLSEICCILR